MSVFLFPGQGSQKVNMMADFVQSYPSILSTFTEASETLGFDVWEICQDDTKINQTAFTQPVLLTASIALWRLWLANKGEQPRLLAGHSLGEYSALVASGVLTFADAVKLVHMRGKYMQEAVAEGVGAMAAVLGKTPEEVEALCKTVSTPEAFVSAANDNCSGQVVVSGHALAIEKLITLSKEQKFKVIKLAVSVPSHCALMQPAAEKLAVLLDDIVFSDATIPVIQNRYARVEKESSTIKAALIEQLSQPVLWRDTMQLIASDGIGIAYECGAGKTLVGLLKREKLATTGVVLGTVTEFEKALQAVS